MYRENGGQGAIPAPNDSKHRHYYNGGDDHDRDRRAIHPGRSKKRTEEAGTARAPSITILIRSTNEGAHRFPNT
jgi:hypothetical protein